MNATARVQFGHIQRTTNELLQIQRGSLYTAFHRLERLLADESKWKQIARAVAQVVWFAKENLT
jgi:hypothetical protein